MLLILLLIWLVTGAALVALAVQRQLGSAGLPLAYFLGLTINHVPGVLLYLDGEELNSGAVVTRIGFEQTVIGMVAFLIGVAIARYFLVTAFIPNKGAGSPKDFGSQRNAWDQLALICLAIGAVAYFVFIPLLSSIPSASSILSSLGSLVMVGACLRFWGSNEEGGWKFWSTMALLPLFPLTTLIHSGFLGFGVMWTIAVATFLFAQSKRPIGYFLLAPIVFYIGLSVFVTYMAARDEIRQTIWYDQAGIGSSLQKVADTLNGFSWLDLSNLQHREALESRLNEDFLVGTAVARLQSGDVEFASGETLWKVVMSLIPRAVWPDKPAVGGGGTIVQDFTGIEFADGTSVGAGQVLEFYIPMSLANGQKHSVCPAVAT